MRNLINFRPALFCAISLIVGILSAFLIISTSYIWLIIILSIFAISLLLFLLLSRKNIHKKAIFCIICSLVALVGGISCAHSIKSYSDADLGNINLFVEGKVIEVYEIDGGKSYFLNEVNFSGIRNFKSKYKLSLYVFGYSDFDIGDKLSFYSTVNDVSLIYEQKLNIQNVASLYKYNSTVDVNEITLIDNNKNLFETLNTSIRDVLKSGLDKDEFSISYALMCGVSEYMDEELIYSYRQAGVAHIFAVSGLHIGFMASIVSFILSKLHANKTLTLFLSIAVLILYSGVCGFSTSSLRAVIMFSVIILSRMLGKKYDSLSSISLACILILLFSPLQLFCVGFQLSFAVVLGIILLSSKISKLFKFLPNKLSSSLGAVLSAQIAGFPILLDVFGSVTSISIIMNLLLLPLVSIIFVALFLLTIISLVIGYYSYILFPVNIILKAINGLIKLIDYRFFIISGFSFGIFAVFYYLVFIILSGKINVKKVLSFILAITLSFTTILGVTLKTFVYNENNTIYVIGSETLCASVVNYEKQRVMVVNAYYDVYSLGRLRRLQNLSNIDKIDKLIFATGERKVDIQEFLNRLFCVWFVEEVYYFKDVDSIEHLVLEKSFPKTKFNFYQPSEIIVDDDISFRFALDGYATEINFGNTKTVFFSKLGNGFSYYDKETFNADVIVVCDYIQELYGLNTADNYISYFYNGFFVDGQRRGTYRLDF